MPNPLYNKQAANSRAASGMASKGPSGKRTQAGRNKPGFAFKGSGPGRVSADRSAGTYKCKAYPDREGL